MKARKRLRGYTLIELLVVLAVLGVLASAVWPLTELNVERERERKLERALWDIRTALDAYKHSVDVGSIKPVTDSGYPPDLETLTNGVPDLKTGQMHFFLRRIPRDPFAPSSSAPAAQTWGLRSYSSPVDRPQAGRDVYDVYSQASGIGLNGTPLKQW